MLILTELCEGGGTLLNLIEKHNHQLSEGEIMRAIREVV